MLLFARVPIPADRAFFGVVHREANHLALLQSATPANPAVPRRSSGHAVLLGAVIGGTVGAIIGAASTSCSMSDTDARALGFDRGACGSHPRALGAVVGGSVGAAMGALVGLIFRR
jgi:hypothetical protein